MSELNIDVSHRSCPCEKCEKNIIFHGCRYVTLSFTSFHMLSRAVDCEVKEEAINNFLRVFYVLCYIVFFDTNGQNLYCRQWRYIKDCN